MSIARTVISLLILTGALALAAIGIAEREITFALAGFVLVLLALATFAPRLSEVEDGVDDNEDAISSPRMNPATLLPMIHNSRVDISGSPFGIDTRPKGRSDGI